MDHNFWKSLEFSKNRYFSRSVCIKLDTSCHCDSSEHRNRVHVRARRSRRPDRRAQVASGDGLFFPAREMRRAVYPIYGIFFEKTIFKKKVPKTHFYEKQIFKNPFFFFKKYSLSTANFINAAQPHVIVGILPCTNTNLREVDNKELREVMDVNVAAFTMFAEFPGVNIINIQHPDDPFIVDNNSEEDNRSVQFLQRIHDRSIGFLPKFEEVQKPRNKQGLAGKLQVSTETAAYLFPSRRAITAANMRKGWKRLGVNVVRCGEM